MYKAIITTAFTMLGLWAVQVTAQNTFPASGNVGIGTTAPQNKLDIRSSGLYEGLRIGHGPNGVWTLLLGGSLGNGAFNGVSQQNDAGIIYGGSAVDQASGFVIAPWASSKSGIRMGGTGLVTFNTSNPLDAFDISHSNGYWVKLHAGSLTPGGYNGITQQNDAGIVFGGPQPGSAPGFIIAPWANAASGLRIQGNGAVKIGNVSTPAGYNLYVENGILTEKVKVAVKSAADWADHVFQENYELMPLEQLARFVRHNKHLPGIPPAATMVKEGNDLGKTDARLLEKIEELTLYIISQQEQINGLKQEIKKLSNKN